MSDEFETRLRDAFASADVPAAPRTIGARVVELRQSGDARPGPTRLRRHAWALVGGMLVISVALAGVLVSIGRTPGPAMPTPPSVGPTISAAPSEAPCDVSTPVRHGDWWEEIGGPRAFFQVFRSQYYASPYGWLMIVRFEPDAADGEEVGVWVERIGADRREAGALNSRMDPGAIYRGASPAPLLPGGWYLFEQVRLPTAGCWRLVAAIDGRAVGEAVVEVEFASRLPRPGTYATTTSVEGRPCFAFRTSQLRYEETTAVDAWQWDPDVDGQCGQRPDGAGSIAATIGSTDDGAHLLTVTLVTQDGRPDELAITLHVSECCTAGVALSVEEPSIFFDREYGPYPRPAQSPVIP